MGFEKTLLDPENRYPGDALTPVEMRALNLWSLLPVVARLTRTREVIQMDVGEPHDGLICVVTAEALEIRFPITQWQGPHQPVLTSELWQRLEWLELDNEAIASWLKKAQRAQAAKHRTCAHCGQRIPPGHTTTLVGGVYCHGCSTSQFGIIY